MFKINIIKILSVFAFIIVFSSFSFGNDAKGIELIIHPGDCNVKEMHLYQFMGLEFEHVKSAKQESNGDFVFKFKKSPRTFYYVGNSQKNVRPVLIGNESEVVLTANCTKMRSAIIEKSKENLTYDKLMPRITAINKENAQLSQEFLRALQQKKDIEPIKLKLKSLDTDRKTLISDMGKINPYFEAIATLYSYMSFQNNQGEYKNELDYYMDKYYDLLVKDKSIYDRMPHVYESVKSFSQPLLNIRTNQSVKINALGSGISVWSKGSDAYRMALGAIIQTSMGKQNDIYAHFGKEFIQLYGNDYPEASARLQKGIKSMAGISLGGEAIDIVMNDPDGNELKLSDLKGKIVLIDFWASWCGPCRKENPHVKKLYKKYKDAGFEVFAVSLDRTESSWKGAIERDGLTWMHVSDLKGWKNAAAKMYGVRSIPDAFLLDKEGKIIGTKMRGPALDAKLKEVFGF